MKKKLYILIAVLIATLANAQPKRVQTSIDTTKNKIGAQFNLTLRTDVDTLSTVFFPKGTHFGPMEVIRSYQVDTIRKNDRYELVKKYGLAQFDSGKYTIPPLRVIINKKPFLTDSLTVEVSNVKVDTLQQKMYEIKPIIAVPSNTFANWWKYLIGLLVIAGLGALAYFLIKKSQQKKAEAEIFKTPIERATTLLKTLEKKELWQKGEIKEYYSQLTDIARNYIEEAVHIPAMESTTSELIEALRSASIQKKMTLTPETMENLERVLKQADLVKFAKSKPLDFEIAEDRNKIERTILTIDKSIPEATEDEIAYEELRKEKLLKKQRRNRILLSAGIVVFLLLATLVYFIATRGFDYVKDNLLGHPTKELLEGEWVRSDYGNPGITIETPKVLKRQDSEKIMPKESMALLKEFQLFAYGSMLENFYVSVSTNTYKSETQIDLKQTAEGMIKVLEMQGASNILLKQEEFDTKEGITGVKAYGTLSMLDPVNKKSTRMYYEILLFGQQNGLQQVTISYEEGDKYAQQITERILKSVELTKLNP